MRAADWLATPPILRIGARRIRPRSMRGSHNRLRIGSHIGGSKRRGTNAIALLRCIGLRRGKRRALGVGGDFPLLRGRIDCDYRWYWRVVLSPAAAEQNYVTALGEHRIVALTDGSRIELNTDTAFARVRTRMAAKFGSTRARRISRSITMRRIRSS